MRNSRTQNAGGRQTSIKSPQTFSRLPKMFAPDRTCTALHFCRYASPSPPGMGGAAPRACRNHSAQPRTGISAAAPPAPPGARPGQPRISSITCFRRYRRGSCVRAQRPPQSAVEPRSDPSNLPANATTSVICRTPRARGSALTASRWADTTPLAPTVAPCGCNRAVEFPVLVPYPAKLSFRNVLMHCFYWSL